MVRELIFHLEAIGCGVFARLSDELMRVTKLAIPLLTLMFENKVQTTFHDLPIAASSMIGMAVVIALFGALLCLVDHAITRPRSFQDMKLTDALLIGLAQALAIFPGVSRSGATITTGMAVGFAMAAISGFLCIRLLLTFLQKHTARTFTFYRWGLAALVVIVALVQG